MNAFHLVPAAACWSLATARLITWLFFGEPLSQPASGADIRTDTAW